MPLRALARDFACLVRRDGLRTTLGKVAGARRAELLVVTKHLDSVDAIAFAPRLQISEIGPDSLAALADLNRRRCHTRANARFADDLDRGAHGFLAHVDGRLAGYYWWSDRDHPHLRRLGLTLGDGDVYGFDFFMAEEHRGDGRAVEFLYSIETALRDRGHSCLWGYVRSDNRPARWLYSARGYEVVKRVHVRAP
jgi:GNAT superfamily N-acetyltransferase